MQQCCGCDLSVTECAWIPQQVTDTADSWACWQMAGVSRVCVCVRWVGGGLTFIVQLFEPHAQTITPSSSKKRWKSFFLQRGNGLKKVQKISLFWPSAAFYSQMSAVQTHLIFVFLCNRCVYLIFFFIQINNPNNSEKNPNPNK